MEKLATESQKMGAALYQQPAAPRVRPARVTPARPAASRPGEADDVVDAEIVDEEKDKK